MDVCVLHRHQLMNLLLDAATDAFIVERNDHNSVATRLPLNNDSDAFEEIVLYQMTFYQKSDIFTAKVLHITVVEDSIYHCGYIETVVADKTDDVIKLKLDVGVDTPNSRTVTELMKQFRFGTVWQLRNPDFHIENGDESKMYIRYEQSFFLSNFVGFLSNFLNFLNFLKFFSKIVSGPGCIGSYNAYISFGRRVLELSHWTLTGM